MAINDVKTLFVQDGNSIDYTPSSAVSAGDIVSLGNVAGNAASFIGIAKTDIAANVLGALAIRGVFEFPTATALATVGTKVYLSSAGLVTTTNTETPLGRTVAPSTETNTKVKVAINVP
jgi:predicted RecA/RadA family phage recombinase